MRKTLLLAIVIPVVTGCLPKRPEIVMPSWEGRHFSELLASWGAPDEVFEDGRGGRILIWTGAWQTTIPSSSTAQLAKSARDWANQIWAEPSPQASYTPDLVNGYPSYQMFQVNGKGLVSRWDWREGDAKTPTQSRRPYCPPGIPLCPVK